MISRRHKSGPDATHLGGGDGGGGGGGRYGCTEANKYAVTRSLRTGCHRSCKAGRAHNNRCLPNQVQAITGRHSLEPPRDKLGTSWKFAVPSNKSRSSPCRLTGKEYGCVGPGV